MSEYIVLQLLSFLRLHCSCSVLLFVSVFGLVNKQNKQTSSRLLSQMISGFHFACFGLSGHSTTVVLAFSTQEPILLRRIATRFLLEIS